MELTVCGFESRPPEALHALLCLKTPASAVTAGLAAPGDEDPHGAGRREPARCPTEAPPPTCRPRLTADTEDAQPGPAGSGAANGERPGWLQIERKREWKAP